ncbi:uncharacterized protein LOC132945906 isoform X2 [Metopolophium dirhodum]|uniref:uncharacterized protein LOC132945906 isoform X2 n=1 Tax=Metopolophium dirhodum TaxID=44670 RepID=UPI00298F739E|nr:uncharacterized protein LOC132945906 isoform X2 [Metopolophium dirhodum]
MEVMYSWIIYSWLIFGTGVQCDRKLERRPAVSSCSENTDDNFNCSNGRCIEWLLVCDGHKDCSDGSDETKELCAIYEFGTNMTMDCGRVNIKSQNISEESLIALAPWTVSIHRLSTESMIEHICDGSIIAPNIVISEGSKFWYLGITSKQTPINDGRYKIGKKIKYFDEHTHLINVTMIYLTRDFNPSAESDGFKNVNIIVFVLANKVSFINGFAPICIDWFSKYDLRKKAQMRTIGRKDQKIIVIQGFFPYTDNSSCIGSVDHLSNTMVIYDKICIRLDKELGINDGLPGAGLGILYSSTYFLTGVLTVWTQTDKKVLETIIFTDIQYYIPWIRGILNKHVTVNSCVLPTSEGVLYSYEASNEILSHGTLIDRHLYVIENCDVGYRKAHPIGFRICMGKGKWFSTSRKLCFNCGKMYNINNGMINDGETALNGMAPWNVGVYRFNIRKSNYDLICGGSIISPNLVVSAAHCFWKKGISSNKISVNDGLYKIAVGKYSRNFTIIDNEFTKIMNVEIVYLNEHYYGASGYYADDIAIIMLKTRISFSIGVTPVCVNWSGINTITNGDEGKIVGWGKTEKGIESPILQEASLLYIDHSSCRKMYTNGFERFVTVDKFCAGSAMGGGVLQGDSGAGLSFLYSNSYYLTGVASIKDQESNDSVAVFTEIKHHIKWIRSVYNKYN